MGVFNPIVPERGFSIPPGGGVCEGVGGGGCVWQLHGERAFLPASGLSTQADSEDRECASIPAILRRSFAKGGGVACCICILTWSSVWEPTKMYMAASW
jgi:hypothetical protein